MQGGYWYQKPLCGLYSTEPLQRRTVAPLVPIASHFDKVGLMAHIKTFYTRLSNLVDLCQLTRFQQEYYERVRSLDHKPIGVKPMKKILPSYGNSQNINRVYPVDELKRTKLVRAMVGYRYVTCRRHVVDLNGDSSPLYYVNDRPFMSIVEKRNLALHSSQKGEFGFEEGGMSGGKIRRTFPDGTEAEFDDTISAYSPLERNSKSAVEEYLDSLDLDEEQAKEIFKTCKQWFEGHDYEVELVHEESRDSAEFGYCPDPLTVIIEASKEEDGFHEEWIGKADYNKYQGSIYHVSDLRHWSTGVFDPVKYQEHVKRCKTDRAMAFLGLSQDKGSKEYKKARRVMRQKVVNPEGIKGKDKSASKMRDDAFMAQFNKR